MRKFFVISLVFLFAFSALALFLSPSLAENEKKSDGDEQIIPEQDGIYNVAGHPELKVRVFVHKAKPAPSPGPTPALLCGLSDPASGAFVGSTGWHLPSDWTYSLNPDSVPGTVGGTNLSVIAEKAFAQWTAAAKNKVNIIQGTDTTINRKGLDGINIIAWGRASGTALAVTYTWYYPSTGLVAEVDTIMNQKFYWMWNKASGTDCAYTDSYDAQNILTHELGHWFGLNDYYTDDYADNTMYGYGSKWEVKKDTLTSGDVAGIEKIY